MTLSARARATDRGVRQIAARYWHAVRDFGDDIRVCWRFLWHHDRLQREFIAATIRSAGARRR
jgi:hypothetical protein